MSIDLRTLGLFTAPESDHAIADARRDDIPVDDIDSFPGHPYSVVDDDDMRLLTESVRRIGIATPLLVRPRDGRWQLVSGHRRLHAARLAGLDRVPAVELDIDDDEATIIMVDSNLARKRIPLGQKALALRMKHQAILHQGSRGDGGTTRQRLAGQTGDSETTVARLVRLGSLSRGLLAMADRGLLPVRAGLQLTELDAQGQKAVADWLAGQGSSMSEAHARAVAMHARSGQPLDAGTVAMLQPKPRPRGRDDSDGLSVPLEWIPSTVAPEKRNDWVKAALAYYARHADADAGRPRP